MSKPKDLNISLRLPAETVAKLDRIAAHLTTEPETKVKRPRAICYAIRKALEQIEAQTGESGG